MTYTVSLKPGDRVIHKGTGFTFRGLLPDDSVLIQSDDGQRRIKTVRPAQLIKKQGFVPVLSSIGELHKSRNTRKTQQPEIQSKGVNLQDDQYHNRKDRQNQELFEDVQKHLGLSWLAGSRMLALDDFDRAKQTLNTLSHFTKYGGRKCNYYVCNPDAIVARRAYNQGCRNIPLFVGDCLRDASIPIQPLNIIYLDYTCKWEKAQEDLQLLFENHKRFFHPGGVVLHLSVSKMFDRKDDYESNIQGILKELKSMGDENGYRVEPIRGYASKTMYKIGVVIRPERSTKKARHQ